MNKRKDIKMDKLLLSILSIAYNHEQFIGQAIENWLNQKPNLNFTLDLMQNAV